MDLSQVPFLSQIEHRNSESGDEDSHPAVSANPARQRGSYVLISLYILTIIFALWGIISILLQLAHLLPIYSSPPMTPDIYRPATLPPDLNLCSCGPDLSSALSKSCIYDSLAAAWLPPYCRDDALTATFDASGPSNGSWEYYADAEGLIPITKNQIAELGSKGGSFWSTREWHVAHCMFYWRKYVRMRDTGSVMERRFDSEAHAKHCGRLAMKNWTGGRLLIEVLVVMDARIVVPER
jgi:hypothetical protein